VLFVGDDWAEKLHDVEVQEQAGRRLGKAKLAEGIGGMARLHAGWRLTLPRLGVPAVVGQAAFASLVCLTTLGGRVAVPAGSALTMSGSSSRRPPRARSGWAVRYALERAQARRLPGRQPRVAVRRERLRQILRHHKLSSSGPARGRSPPTRCGRQSWTASRR
jgi:hypothetical protein